MPQPDSIAVQQQTNLATTHSEVRQKLGIMNRQQSVEDLDLHNQVVRDHEISAKSGVETDAVIHDWDRCLAFEWDAGLFPFKAEACLVC